jgi:hypothetical protein
MMASGLKINGGNNMKRSLLIIAALISSIYIWGGCTKEIKGPPRVNQAPIVEFVNIPVEGARFSSDTTVYWYGTDVDGFIKLFRYTVILDSLVGPDPEAFLASRPDDSLPWKVLEVQLENPNSKDRIKMSADVRDPVRRYISSYIFLQAIDNLGAKSKIIYRKFSKNNHFPDTKISANVLIDPYVNAKSSAGVLEGVSVTFEGEDRIDYPRNPPPFEFHWKLYGPFDSLEMVEINKNYVTSVFVDLYGDFYKKGDFYKTIRDIDTTIDNTVVPPDTTVDTTFNYILVDTLQAGSPIGNWSKFVLLDSLPSNLNRVAAESHDPLSNSYWTYESSANIYNVFGKEIVKPAADTTRLEYFMLWCQTRDDSKVPDPVPEYKWISVIEPKFERDVLVLDATPMGLVGPGLMNWPVFPGINWAAGSANKYPETAPATVKEVYGALINNWKPGSFDTANLLPALNIYDTNGTFLNTINYPKYRCTQDYYQIGILKNVPELGVGSVSLRDILKHKIIILIKDTPSRQLQIASLEGLEIIKGISAGMSAWAMVRGPFSSSQTDFVPLRMPAPQIYQLFFGVDAIHWTAWIGFDVYYPTPGYPQPYGPAGQIRIEDFIGAYSMTSYLPDIRLDSTLLETRYHWMPGQNIYNFPYRCEDGTTIVDSGGALPEVGYIERSYGTEPLYLYRSVYGTRSPKIEGRCGIIRAGNVEKFDGAVVACRYETPLFRSSHFSFTFLPVPQQTAQAVFNEMMDWMSVQPFVTTGKMASSAPANINIEQLRQVNRELHDLYKKGLLPSMSSFNE